MFHFLFIMFIIITKNINPTNAMIIVFVFVGMARAQNIPQPAYLLASWYSRASLVKEGTWKNGKERRMANGEKFDDNLMCCATRVFPLGSYLLVTNLENGKTVRVKVTDRIGKRFATKRIDLSRMAFLQLAELERGIIPIKVERINVSRQ